MRSQFFNILINILLGTAWVFSLVGVFLTFTYLHNFGLTVAVIGSLFGAIPGIIIIVFLEFMLGFSELKINAIQQTKLLEKIYSELKSRDD